jgi:hypothetical protein
MIILLAATSITLTALQASINAPRDSFKTCLREASSKASSEKVKADAYDAYVRAACSAQLGSFKGAVVKFDMGNKMSRSASDEDANMMIGDFLSSALDRYKYVNGANAAPPQAAAAAPPTPQPTPAAEPK